MQEASGQSTTPNAARTISCKAWNSPAEYPSWVARCDIKGSVGTVLNPIFWKKAILQTEINKNPRTDCIQHFHLDEISTKGGGGDPRTDCIQHFHLDEISTKGGGDPRTDCIQHFHLDEISTKGGGGRNFTDRN